MHVIGQVYNKFELSTTLTRWHNEILQRQTIYMVQETVKLWPCSAKNTATTPKIPGRIYGFGNCRKSFKTQQQKIQNHLRSVAPAAQWCIHHGINLRYLATFRLRKFWKAADEKRAEELVEFLATVACDCAAQ